MIASETVTIWRCQDGHRHQSEAAAMKCELGREARILREEQKKEIQAFRASEQAKRQQELEQAIALRKSLEDECRKTLISTQLDFRIAFALFVSGAGSVEAFREKFVTNQQTLDLKALGRVSGITIDDYPAILDWVNHCA